MAILKYKNPETGTWDVIPALGNEDVGDVLRYSEQELTTEEQARARANIGAGTSSFSGSYSDLTDKPAGVEVIYVSNDDDSTAIQAQFDQIYEAGQMGAQVIIQHSLDGSFESTQTYYLMRGISETSEYIFAATDIDNQIHIIKYTDYGANREIYTQRVGNVNVIAISDSDNEENIIEQYGLFESQFANYDLTYLIPPIVLLYNNDNYTFVGKDMGYKFICTTTDSIKQIKYNDDTTRTFSEVALRASDASVGDTAELQTTDKSSIVAAINELVGNMGDIEGALDSIIAIQNTLIGGEGA